MRKAIMSFILAISTLYHADGQLRSAGGTVLDSLTRKPLEYIPVYFKGTASGCLTDFKGQFFIKDSSGADTLVVDAVGYEKRTIGLGRSNSTSLEVLLKEKKIEIDGAVVRPKRVRYRKKENPAIELIRNVISRKDSNRVDNLPYHSCRLYEKLTLSLEDYSPDFEKRHGKLEFLREHIDTSDLTGKPILTVSIRETLNERYARSSPDVEKTIRTARRHVGIDKEFDHNGGITSSLEQLFTGIDIFDNEIQFIANRFVSPLSSTLATSYYKYYIMDTVSVSGVPCIDLSFVPYNSQSFGFTGRLYITADGSYSVRKIQLNFPASSNINWVDKLRIDQEFGQLHDGSWGLTREDSYVNFSIMEGTQGIFAHHNRQFYNYSTDAAALAGNPVYSMDGELAEDIVPGSDTDTYWESSRPEPLNRREDHITHVCRAIDENTSVTGWMKVADALISDYVPTSASKATSKFDFGPILNTVGYNYIEGWRLRVGGMTTANLSKRWFGSGYIAYGIRDGKVKGGGRLTHSFTPRHYHSDENPVNNLSVSYTYDIFSPESLGEQHGLLTSVKAGSVKKMQYIRKSDIRYERQWLSSLRTAIWIENRKMTPATTRDPGTLRYTLELPDGGFMNIPDITTSEIGLQLRWAPGEKPFNAVSSVADLNKDTPVFTLSHRTGIKGFLRGEYDYNLTELEFFKRFHLSVAGFLDTKIRAGKMWNQVPWPLLPLPDANQSYAYRREVFHMMNALEFITDQYVQMNLTWHMKGMIFNRIPLIKHLKLREVLIFNGLYGNLSAKNDPRRTAGLFELPADTHTLGKVPYMEVGIGLENILQIFKVAYFYRLTYRDDISTRFGKWGGLRFGIYTDF